MSPCGRHSRYSSHALRTKKRVQSSTPGYEVRPAVARINIREKQTGSRTGAQKKRLVKLDKDITSHMVVGKTSECKDREIDSTSISQRSGMCNNELRSAVGSFPKIAASQQSSAMPRQGVELCRSPLSSPASGLTVSSPLRPKMPANVLALVVQAQRTRHRLGFKGVSVPDERHAAKALRC